MANLFTYVAAALALCALLVLARGFAGLSGGLVRWQRTPRRPPAATSTWAGAVDARTVYVPGTIVRQLLVLGAGFVVAAAAAPFAWVGVGLVDYSRVDAPVRLLTLTRHDDARVSVDGTFGGAEGVVPGPVLVAHAESIVFAPELARLGLGPYWRLTHLVGYPDVRAVLHRRGAGRIELAPRHPLFRAFERVRDRFPELVQASRRWSPPLRPSVRMAELWVSSAEGIGTADLDWSVQQLREGVSR